MGKSKLSNQKRPKKPLKMKTMRLQSQKTICQRRRSRKISHNQPREDQKDILKKIAYKLQKPRKSLTTSLPKTLLQKSQRNKKRPRRPKTTAMRQTKRTMYLKTFHNHQKEVKKDISKKTIF